MMMTNKISLLLVLILTITACAPSLLRESSVRPVENLTQQIEAQLDDPDLKAATLGIMVQSLKTGEILYQHNANKLLMPASNEKIPTAAAALIKFGPDFRFRTRVYGTGQVENGALRGNLVIVGGGDPSIGYRGCQEKDTCMVFEEWIQALKQKGVERIDGHLIGVDDVFDDQSIGYGWSLDDLSYGYSAQISGLNFNENYARLSITVDSLTQKPKISLFPDTDYINIIDELTVVSETQESIIEVQRPENTNQITVKGTIQNHDHYAQNIAVHNPTTYFLSAFSRELARSGITLSGDEIDADEWPDSLSQDENQLLYTHLSPPFHDILKTLMKESQNLYAECFVKLLGSHFGKEGSFAEGQKIVKTTLLRFGLEEESYQYRDGSGLCRYNYISPHHLIKILRGMYYHRYGTYYRDSLPIAGVDGTIDYRMKGTVAQGNIHAKTGTLSNVRCLSGYARSQDDEPLAFSIMANNYICNVNVIMDLQDQICMLLSSYHH